MEIINFEDYDEEFLEHYGTGHEGDIPHSGRYPWGSGDTDYERYSGFKSWYKEMKDAGYSETQIAQARGINTAELRAMNSIAKDGIRKYQSDKARKLHDKGWSNMAIGREMGLNESSVRALLDPVLNMRADTTMATANALKNAVDNSQAGFIDVGIGTELYLGVSRQKLKTAIAALKEDGYETHPMQVQQMGTNDKTTVLVLSKPGLHPRDMYPQFDKIGSVSEFSEDGGRTFKKPESYGPPVSISSKRVAIRYAEEGGLSKDGLMEIRPGVADLSLGNAHYAQVRIGVDDTVYLKGMAMYSNNVPEGYDIIFNTNKPVGTPFEKVLKPMKWNDATPDNPFGAAIRPHFYNDENGNPVRSPINIVNSEGEWGNWDKTLASQFLSKQDPKLAKRQLDLTYQIKKEEFEEIMALDNPVIKAKFLEGFASECDSDAVHLKAAGLPRQGSYVLLPVDGLKPNEIYAPQFENGERVCLVRYPHGGLFEIPELIVNNKRREAAKALGGAPDAVGINTKTAQQLSGADFDGDTALVLPNNSGDIHQKPYYKELVGFDTGAYAFPSKDSPGKHMRTPKDRGREMGIATNLITDMTIFGATDEEIVRAVKYSMVVVDAYKHDLDYTQAANEFGIPALHAKYQGSAKGGAHTLISRAKGQAQVAERKKGAYIVDPETGVRKKMFIDPETGENLYTETGKTHWKGHTLKSGEVRYKEMPNLQTSTKMAETKDAFTLSTGSEIEDIYAAHANGLKALANEARKAYLNAGYLKYNPEAKKEYAAEVATLKAKLQTAQKNAPLERLAQIVAGTIYKAKTEDQDLDSAEKKKIKGRALIEARLRVGAKKVPVEITPREWEAIQKGAISHNLLQQICNNTDLDKLKEYSMPRNWNGMSTAKVSRAKDMLAKGYTWAEVASALGVSTSTLVRNINGENGGS